METISGAVGAIAIANGALAEMTLFSDLPDNIKECAIPESWTEEFEYSLTNVSDARIISSATCARQAHEYWSVLNCTNGETLVALAFRSSSKNKWSNLPAVDIRPEIEEIRRAALEISVKEANTFQYLDHALVEVGGEIIERGQVENFADVCTREDASGNGAEK